MRKTQTERVRLAKHPLTKHDKRDTTRNTGKDGGAQNAPPSRSPLAYQHATRR